jgi:shikimate kinase
MTAVRRVYIIGFMGSGKSTISKKLAANLGWQFIDLDKEIELKAGKSIRDIFSASGEGFFRKLETETLFNLKTALNTVISTGGGTPCHGSNLEFMNKTGLVVYLKMTPAQLKSRLEGRKASRPLIAEISKNKLLGYISDKLLEREKYYLRASIIVDSIDLDIKYLTDTIKTRLKQ